MFCAAWEAGEDDADNAATMDVVLRQVAADLAAAERAVTLPQLARAIRPIKGYDAPSKRTVTDVGPITVAVSRCSSCSSLHINCRLM